MWLSGEREFQAEKIESKMSKSGCVRCARVTWSRSVGLIKRASRQSKVNKRSLCRDC